jgi:hypothetical protein
MENWKFGPSPDAARADSTDTATDCDNEWTNSKGKVRCCSKAVLTCDTFHFSESTGGERFPSAFDTMSDEWIIKYDRDDTKIEELTVQATIDRGSDGTESVTAQGEPSGSRVVVDFSNRAFEIGDVLVLDDMSVQDACGDQKDFRIGTSVEPWAFEAGQFGFDCTLQPDL